MFNMRYQQYSLPWLLIVLCFPVAGASPIAGSDAPIGGMPNAEIVEVKKQKKDSWEECKDLLRKKKQKKKNSPKKGS